MQAIMPIAVGRAQASRVYFRLPVSFLIVITVVEQGQCISENRIKQIAVKSVQPFSVSISRTYDALSI